MMYVFSKLTLFHTVPSPSLQADGSPMGPRDALISIWTEHQSSPAPGTLRKKGTVSLLGGGVTRPHLSRHSSARLGANIATEKEAGDRKFSVGTPRAKVTVEEAKLGSNVACVSVCCD